MPKLGVKTSEFAVLVLTLAAELAGAIQGSLPPKWAAICATVSTTLYAVLRTYLKTWNTPKTEVHVVSPSAPPTAGS